MTAQAYQLQMPERPTPSELAAFLESEKPRTHHTNLDNYERIIEDDVKASAIAIAATLYQLAMRDEMLPRLPAAQMPPPVPRTQQ